MEVDPEMNGYVTVREKVLLWDVSERQVLFWCKFERIDGVMQFGKPWAIPENAPKPTRTVNMKPGRKAKPDTSSI